MSQANIIVSGNPNEAFQVAEGEDWDEYARWLNGELDTADLEEGNAELLEVSSIDPPEQGSLLSYHPSHHFVTFDGINFNCEGCDCKPWHRFAKQQCQ